MGRRFRLQILHLTNDIADARACELYRLLVHPVPLKEALNAVWRRHSRIEIARAVLDEVATDPSLNTLITEWHNSVWSDCEHDPWRFALNRRWADLVKDPPLDT